MLLCSDVAVYLRVLSDQYIGGWVYDGFGRAVVERAVVAIVMMITIDKEYWSWVSI